MKGYTFTAAALILVFLASAVGAGEGKISGYAFGDYYYVIAADDNVTKSAFGGSMPKDAGEKQNGIQFRRIYFTYDKDIADEFSMRWRLEMNDAGPGGGKMVPFVKHGYLKWKDGVGDADLYLGLSGTPTWGLSEKVWGYRSIEKTVLDVNKIGSSADLGVALKGGSGKLAYHLMVGNGPGQSAENDNGKKLYGAVQLEPAEGTYLRGYVDYNMKPADQNELTLKGFAGLQKESFHGGVELFTRINKKAGALKKAGDDETISGASVFGALDLGEALAGFGRLDMVSNNDTDTTDLLVIAGVDHEPADNVHLMPNLRVELPDGPDPSIQARVTFYYKF